MNDRMPKCVLVILLLFVLAGVAATILLVRNVYNMNDITEVATTAEEDKIVSESELQTVDNNDERQQETETSEVPEKEPQGNETSDRKVPDTEVSEEPQEAKDASHSEASIEEPQDELSEYRKRMQEDVMSNTIITAKAEDPKFEIPVNEKGEELCLPVFRREDIPEDELWMYSYGEWQGGVFDNETLNAGSWLSRPHFWSIAECLEDGYFDGVVDEPKYSKEVDKLQMFLDGIIPGSEDVVYINKGISALCEFKGWSVTGPEIKELVIEHPQQSERNLTGYPPCYIRVPGKGFYNIYLSGGKAYIEDATEKMFRKLRDN